MTSTETFIVALVTAIMVGLPAILAAVNGVKTNRQLNTGNGRTIGENNANIAAAVTTPPNETRTLGALVADGVKAVEDVQDALTPPAPPKP